MIYIYTILHTYILFVKNIKYIYIFTFFFYIVTKLKKIQEDDARKNIKILYNDTYIYIYVCSFDTYYGVTTG